jgi:hypothetical protein
MLFTDVIEIPRRPGGQPAIYVIFEAIIHAANRNYRMRSDQTLRT